MSFSMTQDDADAWKEKYFKLLDSQEQSEKRYKSHEELLCKALVRFTLAVKGINPALDPQLARIREALKSGLQHDALEYELQEFSNALLALDDASVKMHCDAGLLFDFLFLQYHEHQQGLLRIQQQYDSDELINHQRLFLMLAQLLEPKPSAFQSETAQGDLVGEAIIGQHLLQLLDTAEFPDDFVDSVRQLRQRLLMRQPLVSIFDDAVNLLLEVKKHIENEQQELANFLSTLPEQLAEIGLKASGVNIAAEDAMKKRHHLDQDVAAQMADLQKRSASATQLEPLKQLISIRLVGISQQIQNHNRLEQEKKAQLQRELYALTQKISDMESEACELKKHLDQAQRRASLDPLTSLPNRMAFDDRLLDEIARCERHGHPLTLAVWDVDFFKAINDTYGHKSGDKALVIISKLMSSHCRKSDFLARFGGEEFVMLFPETSAQAALLVANKLRGVIANSGFNANGHKVAITLSCGITEYIAGDDSESFFVRADKALYKAKQDGRNKCVCV